jgi:hypothetical protein
LVRAIVLIVHRRLLVVRVIILIVSRTVLIVHRRLLVVRVIILIVSRTVLIVLRTIFDWLQNHFDCGNNKKEGQCPLYDIDL